ncbi:MAG TPA: amino acid permease [Candidatus Bathyarchaeia archaeon]|nr:amino acid permease [Candidatus Bathyarchaeia archaeon]
MHSKPSFKPILGYLSATGISIGGIIGSGIFFIMGIATEEAGAAVILSLVLAGGIAVLTSLSFASLGSKIQKEGGEYQFVYLSFGPKIGFAGGILWILSTSIAAVTVSLAFASYLTALIPGLDVRVTASLACLGFMTIDTVGLRLSSTVNNALVVVKVGILAFFIIVGLPFVQPGHFQPFFDKGTDGLLSAAFLIFFAYAGFGKITAASEEVKDAFKNIPKAIITAVTICSILYILTGLVAVGVVGPDTLSSASFRNAPLAYTMQSTGVTTAFLVVAIGAITATASVLLIQMLGLSRTIYAMSINNQLPPFLSAVHPRFRTPYRAEILMGIVMAVAAFFLDAKSVVTLTSLGILSYYALINLAAVRLRNQKGTLNIHYLVPILGFISSSALVAYYLVSNLT